MNKKHPARCNKRDCQARRNLSKHPAQYKRWPKCHQPGCDGKMYVDWYRMNRGAKDNAPVCHMDCRPYPHSVTDHHCRQHVDYVTQRNTSSRSKHSPIPESEWCPF